MAQAPLLYITQKPTTFEKAPCSMIDRILYLMTNAKLFTDIQVNGALSSQHPTYDSLATNLQRDTTE